MVKIKEKTALELVLDVLRGWGWCNHEADSVIFHLDNSYCEDYTIEMPAEAEAIVDTIKREYELFDVEEYVERWLEAKKSGVSGVPSLLGLVDNGKEIEESLERLLIELKKVI